ncbi:MAG: hypothetical protein ABIH41_02855 [Nanoarchaeota archaeon]
MVMDGSAQIALAVNIGTLAAVVYALRMLVILEKRLDLLMKRQGMQ